MRKRQDSIHIEIEVSDDQDNAKSDERRIRQRQLATERMRRYRERLRIVESDEQKAQRKVQNAEARKKYRQRVRADESEEQKMRRRRQNAQYQREFYKRHRNKIKERIAQRKMNESDEQKFRRKQLDAECQRRFYARHRTEIIEKKMQRKSEIDKVRADVGVEVIIDEDQIDNINRISSSISFRNHEGRDSLNLIHNETCDVFEYETSSLDACMILTNQSSVIINKTPLG